MNQNNKIERKWYFFDAKDEVLGRLSTKAATILRGKNKVEFENYLDCGDYVVIINAKKVKLTGKKEEQKRYYKHTGYIGNLKTTTVPELRESKPEQLIINSVYGMLPSNKLRDDFMSRLKVYGEGKHPHVNIKFEGQDDNRS